MRSRPAGWTKFGTCWLAFGQPGLSHDLEDIFHVGERPLRRDEMKDDGGHNTHTEGNRRPVAGVGPGASRDQYQGGCPGEFERIYDHALNIRLEVPPSSSPPGELDVPTCKERVSKNKDSDVDVMMIRPSATHGIWT